MKFKFDLDTVKVFAEKTRIKVKNGRESLLNSIIEEHMSYKILWRTIRRSRDEAIKFLEDGICKRSIDYLHYVNLKRKTHKELICEEILKLNSDSLKDNTVDISLSEAQQLGLIDLEQIIKEMQRRHLLK